MAKSPKSPLRYPGGKSRALKQILPHVPLNVSEFREPFVGGGSVFFAIRCLFQDRIKSYWINDLNYDLYCFWKEVRDNAPDLVATLREIHTTTTDGRALFEELAQAKDYLSQNRNALCEFQRAVRFFVLNRIYLLPGDRGHSGGYHNPLTRNVLQIRLSNASKTYRLILLAPKSPTEIIPRHFAKTATMCSSFLIHRIGKRRSQSYTA